MTASTGPIEHCLSGHPRHVVHRRANVVFDVATVSVVWFTNTSWRRDQVFAPYRGLVTTSHAELRKDPCGVTELEVRALERAISFERNIVEAAS